MTEPQRAREAAEGLRKVAIAIGAVSDPSRKINIEKAAKRALEDERTAEIALSSLAVQAGTERFLLEMWTDSCSHTEMITALTKAASSLRRFADESESSIQVAANPDNTNAIIAKMAERGLVYIPTALLRDLHRVGEIVASIKSGKPYPEAADLAIQLLEDAAAWTLRLKERNGVASDETIIPVIPF